MAPRAASPDWRPPGRPKRLFRELSKGACAHASVRSIRYWLRRYAGSPPRGLAFADRRWRRADLDSGSVRPLPGLATAARRVCGFPFGTQTPRLDASVVPRSRACRLRLARPPDQRRVEDPGSNVRSWSVPGGGARRARCALPPPSPRRWTRRRAGRRGWARGRRREATKKRAKSWRPGRVCGSPDHPPRDFHRHAPTPVCSLSLLARFPMGTGCATDRHRARSAQSLMRIPFLSPHV